MGSQFFDTNVLIYTLADGDPRQAIAQALLAQGGTVSVQVLNEFASVAQRKLSMSWAEVAEALRLLRVLCAAPVPLSVTTHETALMLASANSLSFYDALIVASAMEAGCDTLLTEDMQDGRVIETRLTIRNPFRPA